MSLFTKIKTFFNKPEVKNELENHYIPDRSINQKDTILMCEENMNGWKLEDLLLEINKELNIKSKKIIDSKVPQATPTVDNNNRIINLLDDARAIQIQTMQMHEAGEPKDSPYLTTDEYYKNV